MKSLEEANLTGKRVLLRLSLDVPISDGDDPSVLDDTRLRASLQTLHYLLDHQAKIIIVGKLGRPEGQTVPALSLRPVYIHLSALLKRPIAFAVKPLAPATASAIMALKEGELLGLENLRFDGDEDKDSRTFARKLAEYGEVYVDDDFPEAHHAEASTVAITEFLPSFVGLAMEKEYQIITNLLRHPARPFVAVIGGAKADKLPVIRQLIEKADRVLVGGGVANIFLAAEGKDIGHSVIETEYLAAAKEILRRGRGRIVLQIDDKRNDQDQIFDIGPETIKQFSQILKSAKTIFWNGNLGKSELTAFRAGSDAIAKVLASSQATTIVGGGNTNEILKRLKIDRDMSFVSTGGGAVLTLLSGEKLPAVEALN